MTQPMCFHAAPDSFRKTQFYLYCSLIDFFKVTDSTPVAVNALSIFYDIATYAVKFTVQHIFQQIQINTTKQPQKLVLIYYMYYLLLI